MSSVIFLSLIDLGVLSGDQLSTFGVFLGNKALDTSSFEAQGPMARGASKDG